MDPYERHGMGLQHMPRVHAFKLCDFWLRFGMVSAQKFTHMKPKWAMA
jgi:hypothetical protein